MFERARTKEQMNKRSEEIINACDTLFSQGGYDAVHFKAISELTTFTRSTIYKYYQTKDEVLLDLLQREMLLWRNEFVALTKTSSPLPKEQYCKCMVNSMVFHDKMLRLASLLLLLLEKNSRVEKIAAFKKIMYQIYATLAESLDYHFPDASREEKAPLPNAIFAYVLGLHPMTYLTEKQIAAVEMAGQAYTPPDFQTLCYQGVYLLLGNL
ncbi:TetR family transcriptional regulator [Bacillus sp. FSL R5-0432]|uniref:TetR family transcriptional regulator n=1 Tax=Bacillus sp. FSL R5-0432 TaxID=2954585 RepID=UPI0030D42CC4